MTDLERMGKQAKEAARVLMSASTAVKNAALLQMADVLLAQSEAILAANRLDLEAAVASGMSKSLQDRLALNDSRIAGMAEGLRQVAALTDPVGEVVAGYRRPNGLQIQKVRVPLGVIGIIYEARPNVTADAAALCLKSGNAVILRGGKEAIHSNKAITEALRQGAVAAGLPADVVQLAGDTSRETANQMMRLNQYIDVLIPRGGAGLIQAVVQNATVPVIETGVGNCHVYVDKTADIEMATKIIVNAKTSRPSVCNAAETLLVHKDIAEKALPVMAKALTERQVTLRCCPLTAGILKDFEVEPATEEDWATEYLDFILAVKTVSSLEEAIDHINHYGTGHSECIVTDSHAAAETFTQQVDAAAVYVNASTRFTDGGEFGMGAEVGISTQKMHARGPMGLAELTSVKFVIHGEGQCR